MADTKITALTALTAADPANDVIPIVDVSDTSMAASGTTKKISVNNILGASGTATLASATITGAATVGTTLGVTGVTTLTGNVGVGNAPSAWTLTAVQVGKGSIYGAGNETGYLGNAYYGSGGFKYIAAAGASFYQQNGGVHQWYTAAAGAAPNDPVTTFTTTKMALSAAGDLSITSGNLVMGTSGKGIDFTAAGNASGMTSELLNDYEEGTFTPGITFGGGNTGLTGSFNGRYTKVGRAVTVSGYIALTNKGSSTGGALITGLPFTTSNGAGSYVSVSLRLSAITFTNAFQAYAGPSGTTVNLDQITVLGVQSALSNSNFSNSSELIFNFTYDV